MKALEDYEDPVEGVMLEAEKRELEGRAKRRRDT